MQRIKTNERASSGVLGEVCPVAQAFTACHDPREESDPLYNQQSALK